MKVNVTISFLQCKQWHTHMHTHMHTHTGAGGCMHAHTHTLSQPHPCKSSWPPPPPILTETDPKLTRSEVCLWTLLGRQQKSPHTWTPPPPQPSTVKPWPKTHRLWIVFAGIPGPLSQQKCFPHEPPPPPETDQNSQVLKCACGHVCSIGRSAEPSRTWPPPPPPLWIPLLKMTKHLQALKRTCGHPRDTGRSTEMSPTWITPPPPPHTHTLWNSDQTLTGSEAYLWISLGHCEVNRMSTPL